MKRKKRWIYIALGAIAVCVIAGIVGASELKYRFGTATAHDAVIYVPTGGGFDGLMDSLRTHDVLKNPPVFRRIALRRGLDESLKPGRYAVKAGMTHAALINRLRGGAQSPVRVTFNNIRTPDRLAGVVSRNLEIDSVTLLRALTDKEVAASYGYTLQTFPGMFIPNTYEMYWNSSVDDFLERMQRESDRFWAQRADKLAASKLSRNEVTTLASIVYEETKKKDEMPRVAGVYLNRLKAGMPLQADPTVKFAVGDFSIKRVLNRHLTVDSPYNTYKYAGLPPGPICMPSIDAIDAVLSPEQHQYLYFCAKADLSGYHAFAKTLSEHNRNAEAYHRAITRLGIR